MIVGLAASVFRVAPPGVSTKLNVELKLSDSVVDRSLSGVLAVLSPTMVLVSPTPAPRKNVALSSSAIPPPVFDASFAATVVLFTSSLPSRRRSSARAISIGGSSSEPPAWTPPPTAAELPAIVELLIRAVPAIGLSKSMPPPVLLSLSAWLPETVVRSKAVYFVLEASTRTPPPLPSTALLPAIVVSSAESTYLETSRLACCATPPPPPAAVLPDTVELVSVRLAPLSMPPPFPSASLPFT